MRVAGIDERGAIATRGGGVELVETSGEGRLEMAVRLYRHSQRLCQ